jgi:hypothetical protein
MYHVTPVFSPKHTHDHRYDYDYWVSTNAIGSNGIGTFTRPFDASTRVKFDTLMDAVPKNRTIHLMAGTYQTWGMAGYRIKSGQKIIGAGRDSTIIQMASDVPPQAWGDNICVMQSQCVYPLNSGIEVSDLTLDANYQSGSTNGRGGITLYATDSAIRRVNWINGAHIDGNRMTSESWGFLINGGTNNSSDNIIEDCEISNYHDGALSGFALCVECVEDTTNTTIGGIIRSNRAYMTGSTNLSICILSGAGMKGVLFEENYVEDAKQGFHIDTTGMSNVTLRRNTLKNVWIGFIMCALAQDNITFSENSILLDPALNSKAFMTIGNTYTNISILKNRVTVSGASQGNTSTFMLLENISGLTMVGNMVDSAVSGASELRACTGVRLRANRDEHGHLLPSLN